MRTSQQAVESRFDKPTGFHAKHSVSEPAVSGATLNQQPASLILRKLWCVSHPANMIEKYAAVIPDVSDEVLDKLNAARVSARRDGHKF
ncbi:hypothetical protein FGK64_03835 [Arenibacterium halophilum]|uniref:Uncharacterized protein n=1 Tax=Arenibacterium halophilum TaxID=2583821 RepID=A0ABY2XDQ0_9RHOB|nr:hypothetical protein FGK64_03835 [Arenibacterium halophilum]